MAKRHKAKKVGKKSRAKLKLVKGAVHHMGQKGGGRRKRGRRKRG